MVLIVVLLAAGWIATRPKGTDEEQIRDLTLQAEEAVRSRNLSKLMSIFSEDYSGAGGTRDQIRLLTMQAFRNSRETYLDTGEPEIQVSGDNATLTTEIRAGMESEGGSETSFQSSVTVRLRKEEGRRLLIYPVQVWRVVSSDSSTALQDLF